MATPGFRSIFICLALVGVFAISEDGRRETLEVEVDSIASKSLMRSASLEKHAPLPTREGSAAELRSYADTDTRNGNERPPFTTTFSTCDGTHVPCNTSADPCLASDSCVGVYHSCGGKYTQCMLSGGKCKTPPEEKGRCYLKCQGYFVERFTHNTTNVTYTNPACNQLDNRTCQNSYVVYKQATLESSLGMQCKLKKRRTCVDEGVACAMQNQPASFGPPSSWYEGPSNSSNETNKSESW
eukprot:CAMPEP_0197664216 /NCGR_PEP_ID=MMETSP1338-20131121/58500_1 /TAXON_ID=43686 ORGANISM="Pelagodinium beii, Strain RCC1491" /NCGR_SAMPLE_ID=MMETSP1338 /ASSEMBLY_ACC=CAM_ASM_000754 /LENGTH=240 /DNA_ID=CAMNT_0043242805 /DNA_START=53 /DNA_END=772 /DNA_ORIENTATION=+